MAEIEIRDLNNSLLDDPLGAIMAAEDKYHTRVGAIADYIVNNRDIRIVLLAGPSGSGKTTSANLIKDAIIARGVDAMVVSLDDFYRDSSDPDYPRTQDGERDFECPDALNMPDLQATLADISDGRSFKVPRYDFKVGGRVEEKSYTPMPGGCVIIEGLHALNPRISNGLPSNRLLKIFVSVSTNINNFGSRIISGRKIRFVRRMVRDSLYRNADAMRTLSMWRGVLDAEDVYLYPYKATADIAFDTFHDFELGVMKPFAEKLISDEVAGKSEYADTVIKALRQVSGVDDRLIPEDSLIREFIPGGKYEYLY